MLEGILGLGLALGDSIWGEIWGEVGFWWEKVGGNGGGVEGVFGELVFESVSKKTT